MNLRQFLLEKIVIALVSSAVFITEPTLAYAQVKDYNHTNFTNSLSLSHGRISPQNQGAIYYDENESCRIVVQEWGWENSSCDHVEAILVAHVPGIDSVIVEKPKTGGFVKFDDWENEDRDQLIAQIWDQLQSALKEQGDRIGIKISVEKWHVYPTLNKAKSYLYYSYLTDWGDNERMLIVKATLFDRRGYIAFLMAPTQVDVTATELASVIEATLASYTPDPGENYTEFSSGDKVASMGVIGVLAGLFGLKYGKQ